MEREIVALRSLVGGQEDRIQRRVRASLASVVNLISLLPRLDIEGVLPPFPHQGWEISGELAAYLFFLVRRHAPRLILELGSGSSTVLFAAAARANGIGRVVSVEHDPEHFARTAQFLAQAGLSDWVDLIEAPLVEQRFGTLDVQWYDLATVLAALPGKIGLLFVDGPPGRLQPLSRFPALPALLPHLAAEAVVLVDDGLREDEARMIELWRDLGIPFKSEALAFLPRSPMLLTIAPGEHPVAELHRLKASRSDLAAAAGGRRGAERRNSAL
jgi:predicted O-methyltransferase YrrM